MEFLSNGMTLEIPEGAFPLSTDSMVLAHFARLPRHARVLDLGAGCAALGLLLCASDESCQVTGLEIDPLAHEAALRNIERNGLQNRLNSICADFRHIPDLFPPGQFHCCISNPPYFSAGPASTRTPLARREDCCSIDELMHSAAWALRYGGDFFLVHRPERLGELIASAARERLEAKRLCLVRHKADAPVSMILLQLRKGAKPGLLWEELILRDADGKPTEDYCKIYHCQEDAYGRHAVSGSNPHR